MGLPELFSQFF
uniref:Uncharacterized protein n=1 Tax=Arundo donax TaxID=35708 RepID=A0A0A9HMW2_ARUDO